nr:reverse transcriptase domain-containing protein [Tanacetum cinerariifolium]
MTSLTNSNLELKNMFGQFMKMNTASSSGSRTLPSNTITNPKEDLKGITTRNGISYKGPTIPTTSSPPKLVERETEVTKDTVPPTNNGSTKDVQPLVVQIETQVPNSDPVVALVVEPVEALVGALKPNPKPSIPYPSRLNDQKLREKTNDEMEKFFQIFQDLNFNISFADALIPMPKFASTIKTLADLGASINLMPLSIWKKLSFLELSPTCMTLELAERSISHLVDVAEDVSVKTGWALIDVYERELTLPVGNKVVTFNLDQTSRYSSNYDDISVNRIDVIDIACEEYSQEVLGFSVSGNPTLSMEPIVSTSSPTLTPFRDSDFLLEETDAFLAIEDEPISPKIDDSYYDSEGDILLLEEFLNEDPSSPPLPSQELKVVELKNEKSSIDKPPEVKLKDLLPHLEYAFLEGDDKLLIIISKYLKDEEKTALIKVLNSHKQALAWQLFDIEGINPEFCTHKILIEDDFKPAVQHQRRVNPNSMRFGTLHAIISDRGMHFCNDQFTKVILKYRVTHRLATTYHPQTSRQVEVSNRGLKRILEWTVGENRASWSYNLDDAPWAFCTAFKTPIGCTPYKLVYEKAFQLNEWNELRDQTYKKSLICKEKTKRIHDSKIKDRVFNVGDRVLLFNSALKIFSGKLKTRWTGPFTVTQVFPYGTVELSQTDEKNFKVNGHRLTHYFRGDIPPMVVLDL